MKLLWERAPILLGLLLFVRVPFAATQPSREEILRLAASLDELADQQPSKSDQIYRNGQRMKKVVPPVPLRLITPVAAGILKLDEKELADLLQKRERLSRITYARLLSDRTKEPLAATLSRKENDWLEALQAAGISLKEINARLDELYTELAFAALDAPLEGEERSKSLGDSER